MNLVNEGVLPPNEPDDRDERREARDMAQEREGIADIVAKMRREVGDGKDAYCGQRIIRSMDDVRVMHYLARLEAAWKLERDRLMTEPRSWEECVDRAMKVKENSDVLY